jgi:hypothetical protein
MNFLPLSHDRECELIAFKMITIHPKKNAFERYQDLFIFTNHLKTLILSIFWDLHTHPLFDKQNTLMILCYVHDK